MEEKTAYSLWINKEKEVLSFKEAEGFEGKTFSDHRQMMAYALKLGRSGYGIQ